MKRCPNCQQMHNGQFELCYPCFDCKNEAEFDQRREDAEIIRKNTELLISEQRLLH